MSQLCNFWVVQGQVVLSSYWIGVGHEKSLLGRYGCYWAVVNGTAIYDIGEAVIHQIERGF